MDDQARITELLQPYLNDGQFYIVDVQVVGRRGGRIKVTVLLDSDAGITIDECAAIGRQLGGQMDEQNFFDEAPFTLEVSSPGVDYPLTFPRQYVRNVGRQLAVTLTDGGLRRGKLASVADDHIVLDTAATTDTPSKKAKSKKKETGPLAEIPAGLTPIPFAEIKRAVVELSFK